MTPSIRDIEVDGILRLEEFVYAQLHFINRLRQSFRVLCVSLPHENIVLGHFLQRVARRCVAPELWELSVEVLLVPSRSTFTSRKQEDKTLIARLES